jgi:hypothetical protein
LEKDEKSKKLEEEFDPREHRLINGIRNNKKNEPKFQGQGFKAK